MQNRKITVDACSASICRLAPFASPSSLDNTEMIIVQPLFARSSINYLRLTSNGVNISTTFEYDLRILRCLLISMC